MDDCEHGRKAPGDSYARLVEACYTQGKIAEAVAHAEAHVQHLLKLRLLPLLLNFSQSYSQRFQHEPIFLFSYLQAASLQEDTQLTRQLFHQLVKRPSQNKVALLTAAHESISQMDQTKGENVLLTHQSLLLSRLVEKKVLSKEEWKKAVELIVHEDSFFNLKLVLQLAIAHHDENLAQECYVSLRRKKGFSFVKLTKNESELKVWLLKNILRKETAPPEVVPTQRLEGELSVSESKSYAENKTWEDVSEEEREIERKALVQLQLQDIPPDSYLDLLVAYKILEFGRVVSWLLEKIQLSSLAEEVKKKALYIQLIHVMDRREYHLAMAQVESMLGRTDLGLDEFKELLYTQGSLLQALGQKAQALAVFKDVKRLDENYRQLKSRMATLE